MKQPKTHDVNWTFNLECDDNTPEYVLENLLDKILEEIHDEFRKKKTRLRRLIDAQYRNGFDVQGAMSYVEQVEVDEDDMNRNS